MPADGGAAGLAASHRRRSRAALRGEVSRGYADRDDPNDPGSGRSLAVYLAVRFVDCAHVRGNRLFCSPFHAAVQPRSSRRRAGWTPRLWRGGQRQRGAGIADVPRCGRSFALDHLFLCWARLVSGRFAAFQLPTFCILVARCLFVAPAG